MKKITLTLTALFFCLLNVNAQLSEKEKAENYLSKQGELTFTFQIEDGSRLKSLTRNISLINFDETTNTVKAWANEAQFRAFEALNISYQVPKNENEVDEATIYDIRPLASRGMMSTLTFPLSSYPTYAEYAQQMQDFEDDYPALVEKISIGTTGQGDKELLFVKISDNVSVDEAEPKLMFTSSMHGDEIAGYPMMLTLIDYILTVYSDTGHADHARVKNLVENAEIWINPSANPDGTYHNSASNTSVGSARRGNGNNIDLNRNYPDNVAGAHPDGEVYQTETIAFMNFADQHNFVIAANFHGGTELVNYPFDNAYATSQYTHADTDWYEYISVEYATHCQTDANAGNTSTPTYTNKSSYMTDDDDWDGSAGSQPWQNNYSQSPGVTHGAEWYRVYGGRQDYMNVYQQCREVTIELSDTKVLPESSLVDYWYYNRDALLDYLTQGTYGFRGLVKDASDTNPIEGATITVVGHDSYGSEVSSDVDGDFYRPIKGGTYDLLISAPCYQSVTLSSQSITDGAIVDLSDILLTPITPSVPSTLNASSITTTSANLSWNSTGSTFDLRYREVGSPTWIDVNGLSANSYNITGLTVDTDYEFEVRSLCNSNTSAYSSAYSFSTSAVTYCANLGGDVSDEYIGRVQLNTIDNVSGAQSYSDFTNISTTLISGVQYTITVTPQWTGTTYSEGYSVWIDYDKDGNFTTAERVMNIAPTQNTTVSATFTVPLSISIGNTRMRVAMQYNATPTACDTNGYNYGEVEDYTINLFNGLVFSSNVWTPSAPTGATSSTNVLIEDGTYNVNSAISVNNITVNSGATINVDKSQSVTVAGNITNNGEFVLNSDSNEFSSLMLSGAATGNINYNRHVNSNAGGNDLIAPPVSGQSFVDFLSNNSNILSNTGQTQYLFGNFEKPTNDYLLFANNEAVNLEAGKGYRVASTDNGTFTFSGAVSTGNVNVAIEKTGSNYDKWNLIGNPYTTYIKLEDFLSANVSELDPFSAAVYGYDADASNGSKWTIWNLAYASANPGTLIAPGQGFFVSSKDGGANISFTPSMRSIGSSDDFIAGRNPSTTLGHFVLKMTSTENTFETDIYFNDNSTLGLDMGYDAEHFGGAPSDFSIYSELAQNNEGKDMAIQSIGNDDLNNTTTIPLGINANLVQQLVISLEGSNVTQDVYLEDIVDNTITHLNSEDFSFIPNSNMSGIGRFYLRFGEEVLSTNTSEFDGLQIFNDAELQQIVIKGQLNEKTKLALYDIQGREVIVKDLDINKNFNTVNTSGIMKGIYLVQLNNGANVITKKLVIR